MHESVPPAASTDRTPSSTARRRATRPSSRPASHAKPGRGLTIDVSEAQRAILREWAEAKRTSPEALAQEAFDAMCARIHVSVEEYRRRRAAFDRDTVAEIENASRRLDEVPA